MASDRDELARTATALVGGVPAARPDAEAPGATLGRYRLERELGAGGMGVVHAAFDPDLERRVALKVLRVSAPSLEAKDRLMREARAMARLSHPNVVTVHEVGTANGRDFVAMELIHGDNLADWLRTAKRPVAQVIDAFVAAGRGLAAAHAAGIVHRDFKPHNVLRSRDGRIVVTDFGLAREAEGVIPLALETTLPIARATATTQSSLSGITVTGSLLGTPAYMAPEQWSRGAVTPATDQFAYCVALWEALAGARPYPGPTLDDLRAQVARGPDALDASRIPRRLRKILRRGLDPAPGARWPSMDALLARLVRAQRRPVIAIAAASSAAAIALVAAVMLTGRGEPIATCAPPARALAQVWSPAIAADLLAHGHAAHVAVLGPAIRDWQLARAAACHAPAQVQPARLECLDGVLARLDAARQGFARSPNAEGLASQLIDPALCQKPAAELPRLTLAPSPDVVAAYALYAASDRDPKPDRDPIAELINRPTADPCARVIAMLAFDATGKEVTRARVLLDETASTADQCGDDRLRADLLIVAAPYRFELPMVGPKGQAALRLAHTAAARVLQPDVTAALALGDLYVAESLQRWDEAFKLLRVAFDGYGARGLKLHQARTIRELSQVRLMRGEPGDLAPIAADTATWRPVALANQQSDLARALDFEAASARYRLGDVAGAHAELTRLWRTRPDRDAPPGARPITGEVVDAAGRPVAGAEVAAASVMVGNPATIAEPSFGVDDSLRIATSDDHGRFTIADAAPFGPVIAAHGEQRSDPRAIAPHVRLVVRPTRRVRGRVALGATPYTQVGVMCEPISDVTGRYHLVTPVAADGTFELAGVSTGAIRVAVSFTGREGRTPPTEYRTVPASTAPVTDLALAVPSSSRTIDIVVRSALSTPLDGAQLVLIAGKQQLTTVAQLIRMQFTGTQVAFARPVVGENVPAAVLDKVHAGDLVAHVEHAAPGDLTVCAIAFTGELFDPEARKRLQNNVEKLALHCEPLGPTTNVLVITAPPQQRLD